MAKKILVADDEVPIRRIITEKLSSAGYTIFIAKNGQEAVEIAKKEKPDLIIMDIMMPVMNGIEAIKILKQDPDMANTHMFVLTAMEFGETEKEIVSIVGASNVINKPFSPKELLNAIDARIGKA
ncbi:response regulator [bacterium]|nr:response regulator [bacterium]MBU1753957.1 response regulator [bacterium]